MGQKIVRRPDDAVTENGGGPQVDAEPPLHQTKCPRLIRCPGQRELEDPVEMKDPESLQAKARQQRRSEEQIDGLRPCRSLVVTNVDTGGDHLGIEK